MEDTMDKLKYPIGHFECPQTITKKHISDWIQDLEVLPQRLEVLVKDLSEEQLETLYRTGGWSVRQLIHHIADSHHHSYTRFKWALTEDKPLIKAYEEKDWSNLLDARTAPIQLSLHYITALHAKLVYLLKGLSRDDFKRSFLHPEGNVSVSIESNIGVYAWHSNHHYAHIESLLKRKEWLL